MAGTWKPLPKHRHAGASGGQHGSKGAGSQDRCIKHTLQPHAAQRRPGKQQGDKGAKAKPRRARELPRKQRQRRPRHKSW